MHISFLCIKLYFILYFVYFVPHQLYFFTLYLINYYYYYFLFLSCASMCFAFFELITLVSLLWVDCFWVEHSVTCTKNFSSHARPAPSTTLSQPECKAYGFPPHKCEYPQLAQINLPPLFCTSIIFLFCIHVWHFFNHTKFFQLNLIHSFVYISMLSSYIIFVHHVLCLFF